MEALRASLPEAPYGRAEKLLFHYFEECKMLAEEKNWHQLSIRLEAIKIILFFLAPDAKS